MKSFSYVAQDAKNNQVKGVINAENEQEFLKKIKEKGLYVKDYKESDSTESKSMYKFNTKELAFCCRQLSAMLTSGLTLVKSIDILCKEQENEKAKAIWQDIYENVQKGESFSSALEMHEGSFPDFLISMVAAGETSGSLDIIMQRMSDHYAKENKLKNTVKGAMIYPIILLVLCVVIVIFLFTFIMPTFIDMYDDPSTMPALTKVMAAISDFLKTKWYILIIIVAAAFFGLRYALKVPSFRLKVDRLIVKGPGFGPLITKIYTGRFSRTLSSLYSSGIPMVECLERASAILGNSYIDEKFVDVVDEVKQGESLSSAITRTEIFEPMFCSVLYVGEESGALDSILEKTSEYYEDESDSAVQRLVSMVEPLLLIFMGIIIGLVVVGIYPALYGSFESIENE
ncbi:MAG: type II secretion system F family protein [Ruminococcus flavefaciens]|nr:type II secretion system F family protein [Ruminococcus flavefaciens]MCM1061002.1 type II secretion system F family protein [Eubacterium sp.]MCM1269011.1 type II secretion system F family protein [Ruminococcus flavefaciens]MCM1361439.1 type II secretion system F family protein [Clostridiales bacterium]MCM1435908.1 type II secretion system F family protein [Ruminococcus flavefaciens]